MAPLVRRRGQAQWCRVGALIRYPVGETTQGFVDVPRADWGRTLRTKLVYVWRPAEEEVIVFSRSCTDLSCPVTWDAGSACFYCPCHGGIFSQDGEVMAGPPARPLYRYEHRIREDVLEVDANSVPAVA